MMTIQEANAELAAIEADARYKVSALVGDLEALQTRVAEIGLTHVDRLPVIDAALQVVRFCPLGPGFTPGAPVAVPMNPIR